MLLIKYVQIYLKIIIILINKVRLHIIKKFLNKFFDKLVFINIYTLFQIVYKSVC